MITANDLYKHMKELDDVVSFEQTIDDWLEDEVFPEYSEVDKTFVKPDNIPLDRLIKSLQGRGFSVEYSVEKRINGVCYITLNIPPQGGG